MSQGTEDNFFTALGPNDFYGYGFATSGAQIIFGGLLQGTIVGSFGASTESLPVFDEALPISRVGVWGQGDSVGVYGMTAAAGPNSGFNGEPRLAGVFGTSDTQPGVVGTSFESSGVLGQVGDAAGVAPAGVCGTSQRQIGVYASSSGSRGVFGESERSIGVHGASNQSTGVLGWSAQVGPQFGGSRGTPAGVVGTSQNNPGVIGTSTRSWGVVGQSGSEPPPLLLALNAGVLGTSTGAVGLVGTSANSIGVLGTSTNANGVIAIAGQAGPIFGLPLKAPPAAVFATSARGPGLVGTSNDVMGVYGYSINGAGIFGETTNPAAYAGIFNGKVAVNGLFSAAQVTASVKAAVVPFPDGSKRVLYCMESPDHWFEDFGTAKLKGGRVVVKLDADFAKVIKRGDYKVFVTPEGDCRGLSVRRKRAASFEVRELMGGKSSITFSYRIVGRRKDIKRHTRFAKSETPIIPMPVGKGRAPRGRKVPRLPPATRALLAALEKEARKKVTSRKNVA